jgi:phage shock protein A
MTRSMKALGILLAIIAIVGIASAATSAKIIVKPSGDLVSGKTQASAEFTVLFSSSGGYTFDNDHVLVLDTELDNPTWTYSMIMDGIENPSKTVTGPNIRLSGWELSYPSDREISLKGKMMGTAPIVETSMNKTVIRIREVDDRNSLISGTESLTKRMVLNPASINQGVNAQVATVADFRARIESLAAAGVDVGAVQTKCGQAEAYIQDAKATSDAVKAQTDLTAAGRLIDELKTAVPALEAQKSIGDAQASIDKTEDLIGYFKENKSMGSDARLMPIIASWDIASERLTAAKDLNSAGKYEEATRKAKEALEKGNEVLANAQSLRETVDKNPFAALGGMFSNLKGMAMTIGIIIGVVVLVVVAIVLFRRRRHWDELG